MVRWGVPNQPGHLCQACGSVRANRLSCCSQWRCLRRPTAGELNRLAYSLAALVCVGGFGDVGHFCAAGARLGDTPISIFDSARASSTGQTHCFRTAYAARQRLWPPTSPPMRAAASAAEHEPQPQPQAQSNSGTGRNSTAAAAAPRHRFDEASASVPTACVRGRATVPRTEPGRACALPGAGRGDRGRLCSVQHGGGSAQGRQMAPRCAARRSGVRRAIAGTDSDVSYSLENSWDGLGCTRASKHLHGGPRVYQEGSRERRRAAANAGSATGAAVGVRGG